MRTSAAGRREGSACAAPNCGPEEINRPHPHPGGTNIEPGETGKKKSLGCLVGALRAPLVEMELLRPVENEETEGERASAAFVRDGNYIGGKLLVAHDLLLARISISLPERGLRLFRNDEEGLPCRSRA